MPTLYMSINWDKDQIKTAHFRLKIGKLQYVNKKPFSMCATRSRSAHLLIFFPFTCECYLHLN